MVLLGALCMSLRRAKVVPSVALMERLTRPDRQEQFLKATQLRSRVIIESRNTLHTRCHGKGTDLVLGKLLLDCFQRHDLGGRV